MLCDARLFAPQIEALSGRAEIVVADVGADATISDMASRLLQSQTRRRFALAGLSLGGIVAMEVLRQAPERVERLALMATNHKAPAEASLPRAKPRSHAPRDGHLRDIVITEMKGLYLGPRHAGDPAMLDLVVEMAMTAGASAFENQSRALMTRRDQSDTLAASQVPALILAGEDDQLCPPAVHVAMQALMPHAELQRIAETGHLLTLESPGIINDALSRWLGIKSL